MKPIQVSESFKQDALAAFQKMLNTYLPIAGPLSFKMAPELDATTAIEKPVIRVTAVAFVKMMQLVASYDKEICWHGTVERLSTTEFRITDILCYPQINAAATVSADDDKYTMFLMELSDDQINALHFQGHSHVNMPVSPSGEDTGNWEKFLRSTTPQGYWIFCIANKRGEVDWHIYDRVTNCIYEPKDITQIVEDNTGGDIKAWAADNIKQYTSVATPSASTSSIAKQNSTFTQYAFTQTDTMADRRHYASYYDKHWDEDLDERDLEFSDDYKVGFRYSTVWGAYIRILTPEEKLAAHKNKNNVGARKGKRK